MRETLYGRQAVRESLRAARRTFYQLWLAEGNVRQPILEEIAALAEAQHVPAHTVSRPEMARKAGSDMHQGVALEVSGYPYAQPSAMLELAEAQGEPPLLLLLDLIQDVRNLGGVLRTAEAVGVHGVVIQERRAADITPDAVNTSSGAVEHLLVARVTNLAQEILRLKDAGVWVAGLEDAPGAQCYTEVDLSGALAVVVGNEGQGLRRLVRERCDWLMSIPMRGAIESLNAAIAGSVALYEVLRQRTAR
jgi:23S rRNA (guanosine2251-2'-O)-methyltransferase